LFLERGETKLKKFTHFEDRPCGDCMACCEVCAIEEIRKPYYIKCEYQNNGCKIYGQHYDSCKQFVCLWKLGIYGIEKDRPDLIGFMIIPEIDRGKSYLGIYETNKIDIDQELIDFLNTYVNQLLELSDKCEGVRIYHFGSKIGIPWMIDPKYPQGTHNIGNYFIEDSDCKGLWYHIEPELAKEIIDKKRE
jgi:hypothetical protein